VEQYLNLAIKAIFVENLALATVRMPTM